MLDTNDLRAQCEAYLIRVGFNKTSDSFDIRLSKDVYISVRFKLVANGQQLLAGVNVRPFSTYVYDMVIVSVEKFHKVLNQTIDEAVASFEEKKAAEMLKVKALKKLKSKL
jgi:hypothetical protein